MFKLMVFSNDALWKPGSEFFLTFSRTSGVNCLISFLLTYWGWWYINCNNLKLNTPNLGLPKVHHKIIHSNFHGNCDADIQWFHSALLRKITHLLFSVCICYFSETLYMLLTWILTYGDIAFVKIVSVVSYQNIVANFHRLVLQDVS